MGYLGLTPTTAQQNYLNIDDISGSFNGTTTSFALQVGSVAPTPFPVTNSCLISVGGVIQEPDDTGTSGFRISGGNIVFSSAPGTGEDFFGLILAGADYLNVGANFPDGTVGTPSITFDSDTNTGIYHPSADELSFVTGGSDRVRVDSNGRLGIGIGSPETPLHVTFASGSPQITVERSGTSTGKYSIGTVSNELRITDEAQSQRRLTIDNSGHLIVGGTTAGNAATITVSIGSPGATTGGLQLWSTTSGASYVQFGDATGSATDHYRGLVGYEHNNDALIIHTAATERLRITNDGTLQLRNSPGIDFSQIQTNATGVDSETLDSYEEGTWTPVVKIGGTTVSSSGYNLGGADYVKIGRMVFVGMTITSIEKGSLTGAVEFHGLPFSVKSGNEAADYSGVVRWGGIGTSHGNIISNMVAGSTYIQPQKYNASSGFYGTLQAVDCDTSFSIYFLGGWYSAA